MNPRAHHGVRRMRGVTLIELMITVVIVGILAAIAYPSYQSQVQQTRRADGKGELLRIAQGLERCFTRFNSYAAGGCDVTTDLNDGGITSPEGWYLITGAPTATTFMLTATPQNAQAADTRCTTLTLNQQGVQGATGSQADSCW